MTVRQHTVMRSAIFEHARSVKGQLHDPPFRRVSGSTISGESRFAGQTKPPIMSGSKIITVEEERLDNVHPADILREDFLIGTELSVAEVADGAGIPIHILASVVASRRHIDAVIDARLSRYLRMSEGFFLGLQNDYYLEEVHRRDGDALARIAPRRLTRRNYAADRFSVPTE